MSNSRRNNRRNSNTNTNTNKGNQTPQVPVTQKLNEKSTAPFMFELVLNYDKITPSKDGNKKVVPTERIRITDDFNAKSLVKAANRMFYYAVTNGLITSVCRTEYTLSYRIVKNEITKTGEAMHSKTSQICKFSAALNRGAASQGRFFAQVKSELQVGIDGFEDWSEDVAPYMLAAKVSRIKSQIAACNIWIKKLTDEDETGEADRIANFEARKTELQPKLEDAINAYNASIEPEVVEIETVHAEVSKVS